MNILNLRFELTNPFDRWSYFKNLGCLYGRLGKHSAWELEHTYYSHSLVDVEVRWTHRQDHAGFEFSIGILGYGIAFRIHDTRHWNHTTNGWEEYTFDEYFKNNS
jgi:hypothetical protein